MTEPVPVDLDAVGRAIAVMIVATVALLLAFLSITRPAARLARRPLASALRGGGWLALLAGLLLGPGGFELLQRGSVLELRPLTQLGLAWIGFLVGLQLKRSLVAAIPALLWRWVAADAVVSMVVGTLAAGAVLAWASGTTDVGLLWPAASLVGAASIGWSGELRSLRGFDTRAPDVAAMVRAGAGLCTAVAVVIADIASSDFHESRWLVTTVAVVAAATLSLRAVLGRNVIPDGGIILALLATLALVAGAAAAIQTGPILGGFLLGGVITNLRGGSMRRMERLVMESEPAVAAIFFLLAGVLLGGADGAWPWVLAACMVGIRCTLKPVVASRVPAWLWQRPGAARMQSAVVRQAPIAVALAVAAAIDRYAMTERGVLTAVVISGMASTVLPLLWRRRA
ncbi:MAG: hypothetical protein ACO32J_03635 [Phycisphaerales bacterium]